MSFKKASCFVMAIFFCTAGGAVPTANQNFVLGTWARSKAECVRPELAFGTSTVEIAIDADGEPVNFVYRNVRYKFEDQSQKVRVSLGKPHPYAITQSADVLEFVQVGEENVMLKQLNGRGMKFIKCKK